MVNGDFLKPGVENISGFFLVKIINIQAFLKKDITKFFILKIYNKIIWLVIATKLFLHPGFISGSDCPIV